LELLKQWLAGKFASLESILPVLVNSIGEDEIVAVDQAVNGDGGAAERRSWGSLANA
jgi:hypothetical protein